MNLLTTTSNLQPNTVLHAQFRACKQKQRQYVVPSPVFHSNQVQSKGFTTQNSSILDIFEEGNVYGEVAAVSPPSSEQEIPRVLGAVDRQSKPLQSLKTKLSISDFFI